MRECSRLIYLRIMDLKFRFNAKEYATLEGITASALRKRRLSGKLEGQFVKKKSQYFYCAPLGVGPNKGKFTISSSRSKTRRRQVPVSCTRYHNARNGHQLKLANDIKQLARINRRLSEEQISEITEDIFEVAKQRRVERLKKQTQIQDLQNKKSNYGGFNKDSFVDFKTNWRLLLPEAKDEYQKYLDNNDIKPTKREIY